MSPRQARPCKARKTNGEPCKGFAINGGTVCTAHGGKAKQVKKAAAKRVARAKVEREVERRIGRLVDVTAEVALLNEVRRAQGMVEYLEWVLNEISPESLVWGKTQQDDVQASEFMGVNTKEAAGLNVWVEWWLEERKMLRVASVDVLRLDISRRTLELEQERVALLVGAIRRIVVGLGHKPTDPVVSRIVTAEIRALGAASVGGKP